MHELNKWDNPGNWEYQWASKRWRIHKLKNWTNIIVRTVKMWKYELIIWAIRINNVGFMVDQIARHWNLIWKSINWVNLRKNKWAIISAMIKIFII